MPDRHRRRPFWYLRRGRGTVVSDVEEELRIHIEMRTDELIARGLTRDEARREALRQFGDLEATRQYCIRQDDRKETGMRRALFLDELTQDVRIGLRGLIRARVITLTIVATVGLGIGATAAIVGAIDAAIFRPLPYRDPARLVRIYTDSPPYKFRFSVVDYLALTAQQTRFERIAGYTGRTMAFSDSTIAERLQGKAVTWTYFGLLGVTPALGRDFVEADDRPNGPRTVIVSHAFWQQRLGGKEDAIGRTIRLDGSSYTVVGVLPASVGPFEQGQQFFVPAQYETPRRKGPFFITVVGRLRTEADRRTAADELRAINRRLFPLWRASYQDDRATWSMMDLKSFVVGDVRTIAAVALAAVVLVWLIACANASGLLIARVTGRTRELAVRAALGASRARVVRYLLAESVLLAIGAAAAGAAVAAAGVGVLRDAGASYFPRTHEITFSGTTLWVLAVGAAASTLLFGLIPALHGSTPIEQSLRATSATHTSGVAARRLRRAIVASQFAIATPLLVMAGLLLATLIALGRVDLGFDTHGIFSGRLELPMSRTADTSRSTAFWNELRQRVSSLPGVSAVAFADSRPPDDVDNFNNFDLEERPAGPGQSQPVTPWVSVTPEYFHLLGLKLVDGRLLDERDALRENVEAIVVDRTWAARFFPNENPIGKRLKEGGCTTCPWTTVVGVVSNVKYVGVDKPDEGTVYWAMPPSTPSRYLVVRSAASATAVFPAIRRVVRELDPTLPLSDFATPDELVERSLQRPRSLWLLVAGFGAVALLLSAIGIYGVLANYVQQHAKEITIRLALGGQVHDVLRLIVGQGMKVVTAGVLVGLAIAFGITRSTSSLLFGVGATDPRTFAAVSALLLTIALVACLVPARRATRVEPAAVLKDQ